MVVLLVVAAVMVSGHYVMGQMLPRLDTWLDIQRERYARPEGPPPKDPMPADLEGLALSYGDEWAREDAMKRMQELYEESGDWDRVRTAAKAMRVGE